MRAGFTFDAPYDSGFAQDSHSTLQTIWVCAGFTFDTPYELDFVQDSHLTLYMIWGACRIHVRPSVRSGAAVRLVHAGRASLRGPLRPFPSLFFFLFPPAQSSPRQGAGGAGGAGGACPPGCQPPLCSETVDWTQVVLMPSLPDVVLSHPGGNPGTNIKSIFHTCYLREVAFEWELTKETIDLPLGCLQGGLPTRSCGTSFSAGCLPPTYLFLTFIHTHAHIYTYTLYIYISV